MRGDHVGDAFKIILVAKLHFVPDPVHQINSAQATLRRGPPNAVAVEVAVIRRALNLNANTNAINDHIGKCVTANVTDLRRIKPKIRRRLMHQSDQMFFLLNFGRPRVGRGFA